MVTLTAKRIDTRGQRAAVRLHLQRRPLACRRVFECLQMRPPRSVAALAAYADVRFRDIWPCPPRTQIGDMAGETRGKQFSRLHDPGGAHEESVARPLAGREVPLSNPGIVGETHVYPGVRTLRAQVGPRVPSGAHDVVGRQTAFPEAVLTGDHASSSMNTRAISVAERAVLDGAGVLKEPPLFGDPYLPKGLRMACMCRDLGYCTVTAGADSIAKIVACLFGAQQSTSGAQRRLKFRSANGRSCSLRACWGRRNVAFVTP